MNTMVENDNIFKSFTILSPFLLCINFYSSDQATKTQENTLKS